MTDYRTEEEQVEALKKWWSENGVSTLSAIVVTIAAVFGWQAWQNQQEQKLYSASALYQNFIDAVAASEQDPDEKQQASIMHLADSLKADYASSGYALLAAMYKARQAVTENNYPEAIAELEWVLNNTADSAARFEAGLRLSRVYLAMGDADKALENLPPSVEGYNAAVEELKGDIYQAQGDLGSALQAYEKSSDLLQESTTPTANPILALKIQHLKSTLGDS